MAFTPRIFPPTSDTLIQSLSASEPKTRETALASFCTVYYPPIYGYARAMGFQEADAQDRVQDFFVEVVRKDLLNKYQRNQGVRFSSWLITCFKNLVFNQHTKSRAQKRGGDMQWVNFDSAQAERSFQSTYIAHLDPDPTFDLMLARQIWQMARRGLLELYRGKQNHSLVIDLVPNLLADGWPTKPALSQEELAAKHGTTPMRLKAFFNRTLKTQARRCFDQSGHLSSPGISDSELDHLWHLICHYGES